MLNKNLKFDLDAKDWLLEKGWDQVVELQLKPSLDLLRQSGCLDTLITYWIRENIQKDALDFIKLKSPETLPQEPKGNELLFPLLASFWGHKYESLFVEFKKSLDLVSCNYIILSDKSLSLEVYHRIKAKEITFSAAIAEFGILKNGKPKYASLVNQSIKHLPYGLEDVVSVMKPNQIVSPLRINDEFCIVQLGTLKRAELNKGTENKLLLLKLNSWIENVKKLARSRLE